MTNGHNAGRFFTLLVTNAIKLSGLYIALHEAITHTAPHVVTFATASFMMAGAQVSEELILRLWSGFFSAPPPKEKEHRPPRRRR